ncbi:hypothetical protein [Paenibacillus glycanilyticus]|uniref:Uncharacterized protein n=1 Tax=Paenibacillus glycanilyticus TaxID=126569 RepID=A0ABQ6GFK5_9BACL|nr:hypothetical protein [Paenibacillus glycanilyticus]GLX69628.1 hypothetical protein MU1_39730 [Paenibacillus glycanilyticus]
MRGRRLLVVVILIIAAAVIVFFRTYDGKPGPLPSVDDIITELNEYDSEADAAVVLDQVKLTEQQVFIPFVSNQGIHGMGFLTWEKRKWSVVRVDMSERPEVRVTDHSDPAGRYIVWNNNPLEKLQEFRFYLIRDRNAGMSSGIYYYVPRVQMETLVNVTEHPYGAMPYPEEWAGIMREDNKLGKVPASNIMDKIFSHTYSQPSSMYVGYLPVYANGAPGLGSSSKSGGEDTEYLMIMNEKDLENPQK